MRGRRLVGVGILLLALLAVIAKIAPRVHEPGNYLPEIWGFMDFWRVGYLPGEVLREGGNPYGADYTERNPFGDGYPPFSPLVPAYHALLTLLPFKVACWVAFGLNLGLLVVFSNLTLRICRLSHGVLETCLISSFLLLSRPGYSNFMLGQFTLVCVLGTYIALHYCHSKPRLAAFGLLATSIKIQFALPVVLFLLVRRAYRALGLGIALSLVGVLLPLLWIAYHLGGIGPLLSEIASPYGNGQMPAIGAAGTQFMRIDLGDALSKFLPIPFLVPMVALLLLVAGAWHLGRSTRHGSREWSLDGPSGLLCLAVVLLCIYHCVYDFLLLAAPLLAVLFRSQPDWQRLGRKAWWVLLCLLAIPFLNHLHYQVHLHVQAETLLWKVFSSINTAALVAASSLTVIVLLRGRGQVSAEPGRPLSEPTGTGEPHPVRIESGL